MLIFRDKFRVDDRVFDVQITLLTWVLMLGHALPLKGLHKA